MIGFSAFYSFAFIGLVFLKPFLDLHRKKNEKMTKLHALKQVDDGLIFRKLAL